MVAVVCSSRNLRASENHFLSNLARIKKSGVRYALYLWYITQGYLLLNPFSKTKSVVQLAKEHRIPMFSTPNINQAETVASLKTVPADAMLCVHFNQRVHPETYVLFHDNAFNLHPSLLPELKGVDPAFYAVLEGYKESGVTLHHLSEHFDEGEVISQSTCLVDPTESVYSLNKRLFALGGEVFKDYAKAEQKQAPPREVKHEARYDSWPTPKQVKQLRQQKHKLITLTEAYSL